jgi:hypothetical protein
MASNILFTVEDLRTPEGTELVLQQFRLAIDRIPGASAPPPQKKFTLSDLSPQDIADLAKLIRDQLQAPGAAPLNLQDLQGTPAASSPAVPGGFTTTFVIGTLSPNTKPFLTILNAYQVIFYATDFDHMYLWTGFAWQALERTTGAICWFQFAPGTSGWHLCDGSAGVNQSTGAGAVNAITVPDLITGNPYIRGGNAYSGPTATAAIAPTISGSTGTESAHTHSVTAAGSVTGNVPAHAHVLLDNLIDGGNALMSHAVFIDGTAWTVSGTIGGNTGSTNVDHIHHVNSACVLVGGPSSTVIVSQVTADVAVADSVHTHNGTFVGDTDAVSGGLSHTHTGSSLTWTSTVADHFHLITGSTESTIVGSPVALSLTFSGSPVTSGAGSAHSHTGSSLTVSATAEPLHMTLLPYYRL